jgi:hypothetical protein
MKKYYIVVAESKIGDSFNECTSVESIEEFHKICKDTELYNYYLYDNGTLIDSIESCF